MADKGLRENKTQTRKQKKKGRGGGGELAVAYFMVVEEGKGGRVDAVQLPVVPSRWGRKHIGKHGSISGVNMLHFCWELRREVSSGNRLARCDGGAYRLKRLMQTHKRCSLSERGEVSMRVQGGELCNMEMGR